MRLFLRNGENNRKKRPVKTSSVSRKIFSTMKIILLVMVKLRSLTHTPSPHGCTNTFDICGNFLIDTTKLNLKYSEGSLSNGKFSPQNVNELSKSRQQNSNHFIIIQACVSLYIHTFAQHECLYSCRINQLSSPYSLRF